MSQINLTKLKFSNMFSYGKKENIIEFNKNKITQLTAPNGSGKSSIALILQEVLFNKNVKGIKKSDIVNRWVKSKEWRAELEFSVDKKNFCIAVERTGTKSIVKVTQQSDSNILDISEHKVLDTYKNIQDLLGIDFNIYACLGNVTYKPFQTDGNVIINKHINVLKDKFNIVCPEEDHCIPKLFWSAKLHKTPYKSRFIAGARNCTTKKLAIRINMGLKVIKEYLYFN